MHKHIWIGLQICLAVLLCSTLIVKAETPTIITDAEPLNRDRNLAVNGSFEEPHLTDGGFDFPAIDGDGYYFLSPITEETPIAQPDGWMPSGGGTDTYARWGNNLDAFPSVGLPAAGQAWSSTEIHGERSVYLGNFTPQGNF